MRLNKNALRLLKWLFVTIIIVSAIELGHALVNYQEIRWAYLATLLLGIGGLINVLRRWRHSNPH